MPDPLPARRLAEDLRVFVVVDVDNAMTTCPCSYQRKLNIFDSVFSGATSSLLYCVYWEVCMSIGTSTENQNWTCCLFHFETLRYCLLKSLVSETEGSQCNLPKSQQSCSNLPKYFSF